VFLARTVAPFTTRSLGRFIAGCQRTIVRILIKIQPDIRVAGPTNLTPDKVTRRSRSLAGGRYCCGDG
jgi:hypothetical protein